MWSRPDSTGEIGEESPALLVGDLAGGSIALQGKSAEQSEHESRGGLHRVAI
jgi:hypothetical protein